MEDIHNVITDIEHKTVKLKTELASVKTTNNDLNEKLNVLHARLKKKEEEILEFQAKIDELLHQQKNVSKVVPAVNYDMEIDALVKEIDSCINRLKQV